MNYLSSESISEMKKQASKQEEKNNLINDINLLKADVSTLSARLSGLK